MSNLTKFDKTRLALQYLIEVSRESQKDRSKYPNMNSISWAKEFCTIKMGTSRQSGHTRSIVDTVKKYFKKVVYFSINESLCQINRAEAIKCGIEDRFIFKSVKDPLYTISSDIDAIFVDCASMCSKEFINNLYKTLSCFINKEFFFIFVQ